MLVMEQQPAYVLHSRPWRETSVIADLLTLHSGRVSVIIKGARKANGKQPAKRALVQPFTPLLVAFTGRGELRTATSLDAAGPPLFLQGRPLYSGLYANELLLKLLAVDDAYPALFAYYQTLLENLCIKQSVEQSLRPFEVHLMDELGYHVALDKEFETQVPVLPEHCYRLVPLQGLCRVKHQDGNAQLIPGHVLLELAAGRFSEPSCLKYAKYIARANIDQLLGGKPLHSRTLFQSMAVAPPPSQGLIDN
ncbi:MAG: DNA repair protein RecO [Oceanospirillaceae bacterium]|jgi:DNA repair protein RecO (recombination protein O)|nr:DNA repair protein RecO [Oceanospirillaceae bacterium]MBT4442935.1 DNA repair protein RecO [Oceanospirillaceae bacterium]MBT6076722.1 DNA repair protein RecO [Oceanospirillaceae bacterium]MBT7331043.1 DNA repair protein RecO [Oceanospirillaceae bacterium]